MNQIQKAFAYYRSNPQAFRHDILKVRVHDKCAEMEDSVRDNAETYAVGCNASGKTYDAACIAHWWLCTEEDSIVITTAPSDDLVRNLFWRDFKSVHDQCRLRNTPLYANEILQQELTIGPKWYAIGKTARPGNEGSFQGFHGNRVLYITDESSAVEKMFFDVRRNFAQRSQDRFLAIGNPYSLGEFYRLFAFGIGHKIRISAFDVPNVTGIGEPIPGLIDREFVEKIRAEFGEDSMMWHTKILAEFWDQGTDGLIPLSWYEQAVERGKTMKAEGRKSFAFDVADGGEAESVIYRKIGRLVLESESYGNPDVIDLANHVEANYHAGYERGIGDANGVGAGAVAKIRADGFPITSYKGSMATDETDTTGELRFANVRGAAFWALRWAFNPANPECIGLSEDHPRLREDIVGMRYHFATGGKVIMEAKDKTIKRIGRSPDRGDCLAMLIWGEHRGGITARPTLTFSPQQRGDIVSAPKPRKNRGALDGIY